MIINIFLKKIINFWRTSSPAAASSSSASSSTSTSSAFTMPFGGRRCVIIILVIFILLVLLQQPLGPLEVFSGGLHCRSSLLKAERWRGIDYGLQRLNGSVDYGPRWLNGSRKPSKHESPCFDKT